MKLCKRLMAQHDRIRDLMVDENWRTLSEIRIETGDPEASISAQLRHLRKPKFGSYVLEKRLRDGIDGLYEYRLLPPGSISHCEVKERRNRWKEALIAVVRHPETTVDVKRTIINTLKG